MVVPCNKLRKRSPHLIRLAHQYYSYVISFRQYIDKLNALNSYNPQIVLIHKNEENDPLQRPYQRLIEHLIVAFPKSDEPTFPLDLTVSAALAGTVSMDSVLTDVISCTLRSHNPSIAAQLNVLCAGFSVAHQDGPGSVFRNLDARSPSAPVQTLLSPLWRQLLYRVGHIIFRHLLSKCVLLLGIDQPKDSLETKLEVAFLQLSGPLMDSSVLSPRFQHSSISISLKKDVMHCTPTHRAEKRITGDGASNYFFWNDGLPKSHHLQRLPVSDAAYFLFSLIFPKTNNSIENHTKAKLSYSLFNMTESVRDYDNLSIRLAPQHKSSPRGNYWLSIRKMIPRRMKRIIPLLDSVVLNFRKQSFRRMLGRLCPLPRKILPPQKRPYNFPETLINMHSSSKRVAGYLIGCCRQLFENDIFGSLRNRLVFERAVHNFVQRRQLKESFDIRLYFANEALTLTDIKWLYTSGKEGKRVANPTDLRFRQLRLGELFAWIFRGILIPLLHQNFFITESNTHKNRVFYFRREVWTQLCDFANNTVLRCNGQFAILTQEQLAVRTLQRDNVQRELGRLLCPFPIFVYHDMRFIPKRASLRGIQRPRSKMLSGFSAFNISTHNSGRVLKQRGGSRNQLIKGLRCQRLLQNCILSVLLAETHVQPAFLGAAVFSLDDVYRKWLHLKQSWIQKGKPRMYLCCVDVAKSFDTVPLMALLEDVIPRLLTKQRYPIVKMRVCRNSRFYGRVTNRMLTHVCLQGGDETSFVRLIRRRILHRYWAPIISDCANVTALTRADILTALKEFLSNNVVSVPKRVRRRDDTGFAVQIQGVPQGNPLSPLLTSLFYGHVEREDLSDFLGNKMGSEDRRTVCQQLNGCKRGIIYPQKNRVSLLMRWVDDTLFVCDDELFAWRFLRRMNDGWKTSHGFSVNTDKTRANFSIIVGETDTAHEISWCGLLINSNTLEIRNDYSRYVVSGGRLRDCMTIEHDREMGRIWQKRSLNCFNPKLHPLLLDGRINSTFTVALNVYQAGVMCCLKVCSYFVAVDPGIQNENMAAKVIRLTMRNFDALVTQAMNRRADGGLGKGQKPLLTSEIGYLTGFAFESALRKNIYKNNTRRGNQSMRSALFSAVEECFRNAERKLAATATGGSTFAKMTTAFSGKLSKWLWEIEL